MDNILQRLRRRAAPQPGPTDGARRLFAIYYAAADKPGIGRRAKLLRRDKLLLALSRLYPHASDSLQRAFDLAGKWARGRRLPSADSRRLIAEATGIPAKAWDEVAS